MHISVRGFLTIVIVIFLLFAGLPPALADDHASSPSAPFVVLNASYFAYDWAKGMGGTSNDGGVTITMDSSGDLYITGAFQGTADFDPGPGVYNLTSAGESDSFIGKLGSNGNLVWAKSLSGIDHNAGASIALDGGGNVYTTGSFYGTVDFDPSAGESYITSAGANDIYISKLDNNGNFVWAKSMGGSSGDIGASIATDGSGNIYTTGSFYGTSDFNPNAGIYELTSVGWLYDIFISKLDGDGRFVWAKAMGGTDDNFGASIAIDGNGSVYTTGSFYGTADFDPGPGVYELTSIGGYDIFTSKLDASGNFVWAKGVGGISYQEGNDIAVDESGSVIIAGYFYNTVDFDPGAGTSNQTSAGWHDIFISKLNSSGDFVWVKVMGGPGYDIARALEVDGNENILITGSFSDMSDFDPGAGTYNLTSINATSDIFVGKLDGNGNFVSAKGMGGIDFDSGYGIASDGNGNVYTTGRFYGTSDFDPGPGTANLTSAGFDDIFISKLKTIEDGVSPTVSSITRVGTNPTNANGVDFTVLFSEDVTGVDVTDFTLTTTGLTGASVSVVSGFGAAYTVTANTGSGNGIIRLDVVDDNTIIDAATNLLGGGNVGDGNFTSGETYTITKGSSSATGEVVATGITDILNFLKQCPNNDPAYAQIRQDFELLQDGTAITNPVPCNEPYSSLPVEQLTDELIALQTLRTAYYMGMGTEGKLPWTSKDLYSWMKGNIAGINFKSAPGQLYCCDIINGRRYFSTSRQDAYQRNFKRDWKGIDGTLAFYAHEIRHADPGAPGHTTGCPTFPSPTDPPGCDATYDINNLGSYGVQYWLESNWATGNLNIGIGCAPPGTAMDYANWNASSANGFINRFVTNAPPTITAAFPYGGICSIFADASSTYWAVSYIERLYHAGITGGCTTVPLAYCPDSTVTRAQMAVFLEKGLHYPTTFTAPNVAPTFTDTIGHWAKDWIEALKSDGITSGCGTGLYCPDNPVTRAQMAVFLLKSKHGVSYVPPPATGVFTDVPVGYWADKWIEQLALEGITGGCATGRYCPDDPVTRAQMAVFLVKTFGLP